MSNQEFVDRITQDRNGRVIMEYEDSGTLNPRSYKNPSTQVPNDIFYLWVYSQACMNEAHHWTGSQNWLYYQKYKSLWRNTNYSPFYETFKNRQSHGPITSITFLESHYGNGFPFMEMYSKAETFVDGFKSALPVLISAIVGLAGGPVGVITGIATGTAALAAKEQAKLDEQNTANALVMEASVGLKDAKTILSNVTNKNLEDATKNSLLQSFGISPNILYLILGILAIAFISYFKSKK